MRKIAIIKRSQASDWISCQSITSNLDQAYQLLEYQFEIAKFYLNQEDNAFDQWEIAKNISEYCPDFVIFIDHKPHPYKLIMALDHFLTSPVQFVFHIYGDFTLYTTEWIKLEKIFQKSPPLFITASNPQASLLKGLIQGPLDIKVCPFPLNTNFFTSPRQAPTNNKFKFLYTGRISTQKNIDELIHNFNFFNRNIDQSTELLIAGPSDDLAIPFLGKKLTPGSYEIMILDMIKSMNNSNIKYLGNKDHNELLKLYQDTDCFISLSTHNDEDFGMSPAEALATGLPCILTNWGGYRDFKENFPTSVENIPVLFFNGRILPDKKKLLKALTKISQERTSSENRLNLGQLFCSRYSIHSISKLLLQIINNINSSNKTVFEFLDHMHYISSSHQLHKEAPIFIGNNNSYSQRYHEIYKGYFND